MDEQFLQKMQTLLQNEKQDLQKELAAISAPDKGDHVPGERAAVFPNYGDDAYDEHSESPHEVEDYSLNLEATRTLETKLHAVDAALQRIDNGVYSQCVQCHAGITEDRLRANPAAERCMHCA